MRARGFTLVELLVAVAVLAVVAALAWGGLATLARTRADIEAEHVRLQALSRSLGRFEADVRAALARPVRGEAGEILPALRGEPGLLELSRGLAPSLIEATEPDLRRIAWRRSGARLERLSWAALDRTPGAQPAVESLLEGVQDLQLRYLDAQGRWQSRWLAGEERLPLAVELQLALDGQGSLRRVIELPAAEAR